jgi:hypothetical protein
MWKIIFGVLLKFREAFQKTSGKVIERLKDPVSGKFTFIKPNNLTFLVTVISVIFLTFMIASKLITNKRPIVGGADAFRKELTPKIGINDTPPALIYDEDPLGQMLNQQNTAKKGGADDKPMNVDFLGVGQAKGPNKADCDALMEKMKNGDDLVGPDQDKMNKCLETNVAGWTPDQVQMAKALLNDKSLTPEEKDLLRRGINGQLTPEELALARALSGTDEKAKALAREAIKNNDEEAKKALAASLMGKELTAEQKAILDKLAAQAAADGKNGFGVNGAGANGLSSAAFGKDGTGANGESGMSPEALKALAAETREREGQIRNLEQALAEAQLAAAEAGKKIANGELLSPAEQAAIARLAELQKQLADLKRIQKEKEEELLREASKLQRTMTQIAATVDDVIPSGFTVAYEEAPLLDCKKVKPLGKNVIRIKKKKYAANDPKNPSNMLYDLNGKPLSPDKIKMIAIRRKNMLQIDRNRNDLQNPADSLTKGGQPIDAQALLSQNGGHPTDLAQLVVFSDKTLKPFVLAPDQKVLAVLLNYILVSSKGKPQIVRAQVLSDVYNPETNQIAIGKGSIVVGQTQSFDEDTGIMDLTFNKVSIGSGKVVTQAFTVGSADGTMGLRGEVHDTRGKYLLGAFITSFTAGALNWFSESALQPYTTATDAGNALIGAGGAGGADVANKIAQMYAGDLQNAPSIYYVPKGVPIVLFPSE